MLKKLKNTLIAVIESIDENSVGCIGTLKGKTLTKVFSFRDCEEKIRLNVLDLILVIDEKSEYYGLKFRIGGQNGRFRNEKNYTNGS